MDKCIDVDFYEGLSQVGKDVLDTFGHKRSVEIETIMDELDLTRGEARSAFKELERIGNAKIKIGRRGKSTRILFTMEVIDAFRNMKMTEKQLNEGLAPSLDGLIKISEESDIEEALSKASLEQLIETIKENHNVHQVHLVY